MLAKKRHNVSRELSLFGAKRGRQPRRQHLRYLFQTAPRGSWGEVHICDFGEGGVQCDQALTLRKVFC